MTPEPGVQLSSSSYFSLSFAHSFCRKGKAPLTFPSSPFTACHSPALSLLAVVIAIIIFKAESVSHSHKVSITVRGVGGRRLALGHELQSESGIFTLHHKDIGTGVASAKLTLLSLLPLPVTPFAVDACWSCCL